MRGISRVQRTQSRQPSHGETIKFRVWLSLISCSWAVGRPEHAICAICPGADHSLKANADKGFRESGTQGGGHHYTKALNPEAAVAEWLFP